MTKTTFATKYPTMFHPNKAFIVHPEKHRRACDKRGRMDPELKKPVAHRPAVTAKQQE